MTGGSGLRPHCRSLRWPKGQGKRTAPSHGAASPTGALPLEAPPTVAAAANATEASRRPKLQSRRRTFPSGTAVSTRHSGQACGFAGRNERQVRHAHLRVCRDWRAWLMSKHSEQGQGRHWSEQRERFGEMDVGCARLCYRQLGPGSERGTSGKTCGDSRGPEAFVAGRRRRRQRRRRSPPQRR